MFLEQGGRDFRYYYFDERGKIFFHQSLPEKTERDFSDALRSDEQQGKIFFRQSLPEKAGGDFSDALRSDEQQGKIFFRLLREIFKNTRPKIPA